MAYLDDRAVEAFEQIDEALKRRGLKRDGEWQVHGPHLPDMPSEVYVGPVIEGKARFDVAIYPNGVYLVEDERQWWKRGERLPVKRLSHR